MQITGALIAQTVHFAAQARHFRFSKSDQFTNKSDQFTSKSDQLSANLENYQHCQHKLRKLPASCQQDSVIDVDDSFWIEIVIEIVIAFVMQTFDQVNITIAST